MKYLQELSQQELDQLPHNSSVVDRNDITWRREIEKGEAPRWVDASTGFNQGPYTSQELVDFGPIRVIYVPDATLNTGISTQDAWLIWQQATDVVTSAFREHGNIAYLSDEFSALHSSLKNGHKAQRCTELTRFPGGNYRCILLANHSTTCLLDVERGDETLSTQKD